MDTMHVSTSGVYSNGKDFVLRGGPHFKKPERHEVNAIHTLQSSADPSSYLKPNRSGLIIVTDFQ